MSAGPDVVAGAVEHGSVSATRGRRPGSGLPGWFHEPTIVLGEPRDARLRDEELFGPSPVVVDLDNEEAIGVAHLARKTLG